MFPVPLLKNSSSLYSQRKSIDSINKLGSFDYISEDAKLGSSKKITFDAESATIRKQIGQFIQKVAQEASQLKNEDQIIIKFSCSIISRYRQQLLSSQRNNKNLHELQQIFNESASKTMQFLHYQYPKPEGRISFDSNKARRQDIDPRYSIVHKILDHPLNKNKKEQIRSDINFILHSLISHSQDNFSTFQQKMIRIFQKGDKTQQRQKQQQKTDRSLRKVKSRISQKQKQQTSHVGFTLQEEDKKQNRKSSIGYRFSKRLSKNANFKSMNTKSPSFFRTDKDTISILMDWYYELKNYFDNPNLLLKNKTGFRNQQGGITKLIYKDRVKLAQIFTQQAKKLKKSLQSEEKLLREIILSIILISDRELQRQILKPIKTKKESQHNDNQQSNSDQEDSEDNNQEKEEEGLQKPQTSAMAFGQQINSKYYQYKSIHYLDKNEVSFIKICDDIYKAVNDHIMSILSIVIIHLKNVQETYYNLNKQDMDSTQKLSLVTLTMHNIYKCQYIGSQANIKQTIARIKQQKDIDILFEQKIDSNDIILNLILNNSNNKFSIISQIRFTSSSDVIPFSFPAFLLEQASTPFGIIAQLGLLFQNVDKRNKYILKNKIVYKRQQGNFFFQNGILKCHKSPYHQMREGKIQKPYICYVCFKYKFAYILGYKSKYCEECGYHICPICYILKLKNKYELADYLLKDGYQELKQFFQIDKYFFTQTSQDSVNNYLKQKFDKKNLSNLQKYYGVFKIQYNQLSPQFHVVKHVKPVIINTVQKKQNRDFLKQLDKSSCYVVQIENNPWSDEEQKQSKIKQPLTPQQIEKQQEKQKQKQYLTFTNLPLQFKTKNNCIFLILSLKYQSRVINKEEYIQKQKSNIKIQSLHQKFSTDFQKLYVENSNETKNKFIVIDYDISKKGIYQLISDNSTKLQIKNIKNSDAKNQKLQLKNFAVNYNLLNSLSLEQRQRVTVMNLNGCIAHTNESPPVPLSVIQMFPKLKMLRIDRTALSIPRLKLPQLEQLYLQFCETITGLDFNDYKNIKNIVISPLKYKIPLPKLVLQNLMTFDLRGTSITSFQQLQNSIFGNLNRITLTLSRMDKIPLLRGKSYEKLNVIEFRTLKNKSGKKLLPIDASNIKHFCLPQLKYLIIAHCKLSPNFPKITGCPRLMYLRLVQNNIESIQPFQCEQLNEVVLSNNFLTVLPEIICPKLQAFEISNNRLTIEGVSSGLSKIYAKTLDLTDNQDLQKLPIVETKVEFIMIEQQKIYWHITKEELSKIDPLMPSNFSCDRNKCQAKAIRMPGRRTNLQLDYCIPCFSKMSQRAKKNPTRPKFKQWIQNEKDFKIILTISKDMLNAKAMMNPQ